MDKKRFMNKKAQFFLIAALIISAVILTFGKSYTSSKVSETPAQVYDLSDQLQYEASQVIDNGLLQERSQADIEKDLKNLTTYYSSLNPDSDIDVIYGDNSSLKIISFSRLNNTVVINNLEDSGATSNNSSDKLSAKSTKNYQPSSDSQLASSDTSADEARISRELNKVMVRLTIDKNTAKQRNVENSFDIKSGQNLYIIVRKKVKDQDVIIYR